ncbi:hypothetical protein D3C81_1196700 [compost metagenome]
MSACSALSAVSNATALLAWLILPLALIRGARPKATWVELTSPLFQPATLSNAVIPGNADFDIDLSPKRTIILFSPTKGMRSAIVPSAASSLHASGTSLPSIAVASL